MINVVFKSIKNKIKTYLMSINKTFILRGYDEQKEFLDDFEEPINLVQRSVFQYKCQMQGYPLIIKIVQNSLSIILVFYYLIKPYKNIKNNIKEKSITLFLRSGVTASIIPRSLIAEGGHLTESDMILPIYLSKQDKRFFLNSFIKQYWHLPFFCFKCMIKLGSYSNAIKTYNPKKIVTHNEYSFASSAMTEYCRSKQVEHINIMHGEKLFNIRDAFIEFDKFYVWDSYYEGLFTELRAAQKQFIVEKPESFTSKSSRDINYKYEYTYYLGGESDSELVKLRDNLLKLNVSTKEICLRLHPRYSDSKLIESIFECFSLEFPSEVDINTSIFSAKRIIAQYSTVLYQAYLYKKEIVLDDLTNVEKYRSLKELKYIMIDKADFYLSDLITNSSTKIQKNKGDSICL